MDPDLYRAYVLSLDADLNTRKTISRESCSNSDISYNVDYLQETTQNQIEMLFSVKNYDTKDGLS